MKRFVSVLLLSLMVLMLFAGCKQEVKSTDGKSSSLTQAETKENSTKTSEPVTLTFLAQTDPLKTEAFWKEINDKFEAANPGIKIKWSTYPDQSKKDDYSKVLYASGMLPDVLLGGVDILKRTVGPFAEIPESLYSILEDAAIEKIDGKVYGMPTIKLVMQNVYYNKDIFAQHNISIPKTWDEFENICETLKNKGISPLIAYTQVGVADPFINTVLTSELNQLSRNYPKMIASGELKFNGPEIKGLLKKYLGLWEKGYFFEGSKSITDTQRMEAFSKGKAAMLIDGQWFANKLQGMTESKLGWFMLPAASSTGYYPGFNSDNVAISAKTENYDEAIALIKFLFSDDIYKHYLKQGNANPTTKKPVIYEMDYLSKEIAEKAAQGQVAVSFTKLVQHPVGSVAELQKAVMDVIYGGDIDKIMDNFEKKYRELQEAAKSAGSK